MNDERIIPAGGLAVVGAILGKSDFIKKLNRMAVTANRSQHQIKNGDIVLTYLGMLCMGKPYFEAVHEMDDDMDFYKAALVITRAIPSEETLRQYEQFHSEVKTDMDLERLPSGKFATNALILELGMIAYNILRMIGQQTIGGRTPRQKRGVRRRRLRTGIGNLIIMASHITTHALQLIMGLGRSNTWRHTFADICQKYAVATI